MQKLISLLAILLSSSVFAFKSTPFFARVRTVDSTLHAHRNIEKTLNTAAGLVAAAVGLSVLNADFASAKTFGAYSLLPCL
jgi:hypothetical protein